MKEKGAVVAQPRRESATENPVQTATQVKDDGKDPHDAPISVMAWSNMDMVAWLQRSGYGRLSDVFLHHEIAGRHLPYVRTLFSILMKWKSCNPARFCFFFFFLFLTQRQVNDAYLREMGCDVVGERIALLEDLRQLQAESRRMWRKQVLFKQDEYRLGPCYGFLPFRCWFFPFCCDACVPIAEKYMITNQYVSLSHIQTKCAICPGCMLCGYRVVKTNMDLTSVGDVDIASGKPGCCEPMREIATLSINGESNNEGCTFEFNVRPSEAETVAESIHNASVEATMHARALRVGAAATESSKK